VDEFSVGDEVLGFIWMDWIHHGTYAELVPAPARSIVRKPPQLGWHEAAGLPLAGLTAYQASLKADILPGQTISNPRLQRIFSVFPDSAFRISTGRWP
jgi:NADPH:quinone reductase-like Zn-dependent oxidoreductase